MFGNRIDRVVADVRDRNFALCACGDVDDVGSRGRNGDQLEVGTEAIAGPRTGALKAASASFLSRRLLGLPAFQMAIVVELVLKLIAMMQQFAFGEINRVPAP